MIDGQPTGGCPPVAAFNRYATILLGKLISASLCWPKPTGKTNIQIRNISLFPQKNWNLTFVKVGKMVPVVGFELTTYRLQDAKLFRKIREDSNALGFCSPYRPIGKPRFLFFVGMSFCRFFFLLQTLGYDE
jgi:hypothetical protein